MEQKNHIVIEIKGTSNGSESRAILMGSTQFLACAAIVLRNLIRKIEKKIMSEVDTQKDITMKSPLINEKPDIEKILKELEEHEEK